MADARCAFCNGLIPPEWERCPHCARPGLFPNIREAESDGRRAELERRYRDALAAAAARGVERQVHAFEVATQSSKAVITRPLRDLDRIISSDRELFATFYGLTEGEVRLPHGDKWDRLRRLADEALFPGYKRHIRFAALSLDGRGVAELGECSVTLRTDMIAHRASVFESNSAVLMEEHGYKEPPGSRASWGDRSKLCVAKHATEIEPKMPPTEFPVLLLRPKSAAAESQFVEVHIWGPMSIQTGERVILDSRATVRKAFRLALSDRLADLGVELEVV